MELEALAVRCESATAEDQRTMLEQAFTAFHPCIWLPAPGAYWPPIRVAFARMLEVEAYESAAMTLVPAGWKTGLWHERDNVWKANLGNANRSPGANGTGCTHALALTAAALRAHLLDRKDTPS